VIPGNDDSAKAVTAVCPAALPTPILEGQVPMPWNDVVKAVAADDADDEFVEVQENADLPEFPRAHPKEGGVKAPFFSPPDLGTELNTEIRRI
jgi:hypothetical protein